MGKSVAMSFNATNLQQMAKVRVLRSMFLNKYLTTWYSLGYMHVYEHYFQTAVPSLKPLSQPKPNFMWRLLEKRGHKVIKIILVT